MRPGPHGNIPVCPPGAEMKRISPGGSFRVKNGKAELRIDTSKVTGFVTQGGTQGPISITWQSSLVTSVTHSGAAGSQVGPLTHVSSGTWTSSLAFATGAVQTSTVSSQQSAEVGGNLSTTQSFTLGG